VDETSVFCFLDIVNMIDGVSFLVILN